MQISEFTFKLLLVFIPGIIAFIIIDNLTTHKKAELHHWFIYSLILAFISYESYYILQLIHSWVCGCTFTFKFIDMLIKKDTDPYFPEIVSVTILSLFIGFLVSYIINKKCLTRIAKKFGVSKKYGDIDLWQYIMNIDDELLPKWVLVRDLDKDIMYDGYIRAYSDPNEQNALFLEQVKVYKQSPLDNQNPGLQGVEQPSESHLYYEVSAMYLPINVETMVLEFPNMRNSE